ncbi:MAG: SusC/RagA family TonB-linked outer membrane protein [Bacteroidota bacterium]
MKSLKNIEKAFLSAAVVMLCTASVSAQDKKPKDTVTVTKAVPLYNATGEIRDAVTRKPLAAVRVFVPDFSSVITDDNGKFSIKVPSYKATLFVAAEGYQAKEIALKGRKDVSASLQEETSESIYDNAQLPFGTKPLSQVVNAVVSVNTNGNWNRSTETPDGFLGGKAAGLTATMRSGTPNAGAYLAIRGYNSLYTNNQPLVVVDGMIYDYNDYGSSIIGAHYTNALSEMDVRDIENITIIKDGVSTYGTRGANGVILITTNHPIKLATRIDFATYAGVNLAPAQLPVMKADDYRSYLSDVFKTRGMTDAQIQAHPAFDDNTANGVYYNYHNNTNWQDEVFKNSVNNNYFLRITGGDNIAKYGLSMGYMKNGSATKNTDDTKYNVRFNADLKLSTKLTVVTNLTYSYYEQRLMNQGFAYKTNPILLALVKSPLLNRNVADNKGDISPNLADRDIFGVSNPAAIIENMLGNSKVYRFFGSISFTYQLSNYLNLYTLGGITTDKVREQSFIPGKGVAFDTLANAIAVNRSASQTKRIFNLYNETYLDFARTYRRVHKLHARAGLRFLDGSTEQDFAYGFNSATDDFISVGTGSSLLRKVGGDIGKYAWINMFAGVDYSWQDKYFISANIAVDGSSRFGKMASNGIGIGNNKYAVLPSVGASWLVSSEPFMARYKNISLLKLRASIAKTGNDDIGNYTAQQSYVSQNLLGVQGLVRGNIANPGLQWELNTKLNFGVDLSLFNERLNISVDVFRNTTTNMLTYESLPAATGFQYAITNGGEMKTTGIDFSLSGRIVSTKNLKWDMSALVSTYKNRLTTLPGNSALYSFGNATVISQVGLPGNMFYGYKTNGVYATDAEAASSGLTKRQTDASYAAFKGGDMRFVDVNGDKIIDDRDRQTIGNPNPDFTGAYTNKISWKALTLEAICTFSQGNSVYNGVRAILESSSSANNQLTSVVNRWRAPGQVTSMPKASWNDPMGNSSFSDRWIEDGSFFRLKTLSLSYDLPINGKKSIKYVTITATGNNLLTFTKYLGYDPEFYAAETPLARGIDIGLEPQFRSFMLGIRMGL